MGEGSVSGAGFHRAGYVSDEVDSELAPVRPYTDSESETDPKEKEGPQVLECMGEKKQEEESTQ